MREVEAAILARTPEHDLVPSLDRIRAVVELLGDPQRAYPVVHVTGTNGKTSTARMVEALLHGFGMRTGRFTSPHLHSVRERISFDGQPIDEERFVSTYADIAPYLDLVDARSKEAGGPTLSFFEVLVAMGYAAFADAPVDVAVVEVGMGGEWDATNVADGQVSVVTPVAVDHQRFLGSTAPEIAAEKAGIIKAGSIAVLAQQEVEVAEVLLRRATEAGATVAREGLEFGVLTRTQAVGGQQVSLRGLGGDYEDLFLPLFGAHQAQNAAVALAAVEAFLGGGADTLDMDVVRSAFAGVSSPGRLEVVRRSPTILVDAAHNPAGARATAAAIPEDFAFTHLVGVVAAMADKDVRGILEAFEPVLAEVVVTEAATSRAMPVDELAALAVGVFGADRVEVVPRLDDAIDTAVALAEEQGELGGAGVLVTGSIVTVAQARGLLGAAGR
ncbi:bifunctional folylpolyglutamate synthase/dihydrofolate synthase [Motilibacter aurantiacus]|uniref:bifunctional folylpolyglutamate synthase/dihydrofolate synthase n=1 Tax=Motilibacter aurantiacus TaxID=2714955 RepID=UPI00140DDE44|nr:folylpolyglutamate synthase/dihydrofolate synthase family protein [Motilibacter aurantiacus]NHC45115.1 bifunctional folylpolyglutamate synthase/dihydrofolate synthase [Motilibacter aurantiacus]